LNVSHRSKGVPLLPLVFLAVFAVGVAGLPAKAPAQQANPTAPAKSDHQSGGQPSLSAPPGHVKAEEEEEHNLFRHTPLVESLAKTFHIDVETMARTFEWINSTIILLVIFIPLFKFLPRVMRKRSLTLRHHLEEAHRTTADANARLSAVEARLSRLDEEIAGIRAQVEEESKQDEARIKAGIEEERTRIVAAAEQEIAAAAAQAQRGLRHSAADPAIETAARQLVLTPEADRAVIAEFVSEAGNGAAKGGRS